MKLKNKVAIITGAARGIGFAVAKKYCEEGAKVALWDIQKDLLDKAVKKLADFDNEIRVVEVNVTSTDEVIAAFNYTEKELGEVDIIVSNAGIT